MVTVKRADGFSEFARVVGDVACHYLEANATTMLFVDIIKTFHETWFCIEPITCFAIMPDHIHLLIKIRDIEKRVSLPVIVRMLTRALEKAYFAAGGPAERAGAALLLGRACVALLLERERVAGVRVGRLTAPSGNTSLNSTGTTGSLSATDSWPPLRATFERMPSVAGFVRAFASIFSA